jgi:hypothetical protein
MTQVLASADIEDPLEAAQATANPDSFAHRCSGLTDRHTAEKNSVGFELPERPVRGRSLDSPNLRCSQILVHREFTARIPPGCQLITHSAYRGFRYWAVQMSKVSFTSHREDPAQPCDQSGGRECVR